jgi:hypothetical protein
VTTAFDPPSPAAPGNTSQDVDGAGSTVTGLAAATQSALEARTDLRVLQTWTGLDNAASSTTAPVNTIAFSDPSMPDVRMTVGGGFQTTGGGNGPSTNYILSSSAGSGYRFANSGNTAMTVTLDFGDFDGTNFNSAANAVDAVGFVIANVNSGLTLTVDFFDDAGTLLGQQTATGNSTDTANSNDATAANLGADFFFGLDADSNIGRIVITRTATSNGTVGSGLDDFGFTTVPEPGTIGLAGVAALSLLARRPRSLR